LPFDSQGRLLGFAALSLFLMLLTNSVAWVYQYMLVGALIWLGWMAQEEAVSAADRAARRGT
jgi:hypothetical protein